MTRKTTILTLACALLAGCTTTGKPWELVDCGSGRYQGMTPRELVPTTPRLDCGMGDAVSMAIARQTIASDAAARNAGKDAAGMDGNAARDAMFNYQKSFRAPEPAPTVINIGVGGGSSGGSR